MLPPLASSIMNTFRSIPILASATFLGLPLAAADSPADEPAVLLNEVTVSGQATSTEASAGVLGSVPVLDTPYSVSVVGRDDLDRWQPRTVGEAFFGDPSVVSNVNPYSSGWRERLKVRGLALNWNNYRLNNLPVETTTLEWPFELMEQVELFKGVNGFMHGFGTPGGMVNYRTKQPLEHDYTATTFGWYSDSAFNTGLDISRRAGKDGWLGYRVNLGHEFGDTYNGGEIDRTFGAIALEGRVTSKLTLTAEFIHIDKSLDNEAPVVGFDYGGGSFPAGSKPPSAVDFDDLDSIDGTFDDVTNTVAIAGLAYQISPDWKTSATYSFYRGRNDINKVWYSLTDTLGNYDIYNYQLSWDETDSHFVQSLTEGEFDTGSLNHRVVAGASWQYRRSYHSAYDWTQLGSGNLYTGNGPVAAFPPHSDESFLGQETEQTSLFASDTVEFLPGLSGLVGLRYNRFSQKAPGSPAYKTDVVTPTYALIYKPRPELTLYASYVEALERGSTVGASSGGLPYTNAGDILDPLTSEQFEVGLKYEGSRWAAGIAAFRLERGANITVNNGNGTVTLLQDGVNLYEGVEVSGQVRVLDPLTLSAGVIWLDATYDQLSTSSVALEGNRIAGASEYEAVLQAVCQIPAIDGLEVFGGIRYFGDAYYNNANTLKIPSYTLVNLGVGYATTILDRHVSFHAQVNNLADELYWTTSGLGAPRTYALSAKIEW